MAAAPSELPESQKARLESTLALIEAALDEATHSTDLEALRSPLSCVATDVTPLQQQMIAEGAHGLRAAMCEILRRHGISARQPNGSAARQCRAALNRALVAIEELRPHEPGEAALSDAAESELQRIVGELLVPLDRMRRAFADDAVAATGDRLLDELQRVVAVHGLEALRAPLSALIERVEAQDFMVAVFGKVNAGKSSLINRLLESAVLPVDAMPATAVPVLLRHGLRARGVAQFADAAPDVYTPGRLAEFAAEQFNPGNTRHVTRLLMELPAARLAGGITLVDMPGLSVEGAAALPPCDLGIVLIDATGSLALDETELIESLLRAGSHVLILLSKADRLGEQDRWNVYGHVTDRLLARFGAGLRVYLASSTGGAELRDDWVVRGLDRCLAQRAALRDASLRRKTDLLRDAVIAALEQRLDTWPLRGLDAAAQDALAQGRALLERAMSQRSDTDGEASHQASRLLREVAHNAAVLISYEHALLDINPLVAASVEARARTAARSATGELCKLAAQCGNALARAGAPVAAQQLRVAEAPDFDAAPKLPVFVLRRPWFAALGNWSVRQSVRRALLRRGLREGVGESLAAYLTQLVDWRRAALVQLQHDFDVSSDLLRGEADRLAEDIEALRRPQSTAGSRAAPA